MSHRDLAEQTNVHRFVLQVGVKVTQHEQRGCLAFFDDFEHMGRAGRINGFGFCAESESVQALGD